MADATETIEIPQKELPLSAVLLDILDHAEPRISVGELMQKFGGRAIGALLFVFGLACTLPLPPGATTIFGFPLVLLAPQLIIGASVPWLPESIKRRTISTEHLRDGLPKLVQWIRRIEAISRPRFAILFGAIGERLIGVVCLALALVLILPIPWGNMLPALAVSALAFSLIQRDGLIALLGYALTITSVSILVLAAHIIVRMFVHALTVLSPA